MLFFPPVLQNTMGWELYRKCKSGLNVLYLIFSFIYLPHFAHLCLVYEKCWRNIHFIHKIIENKSRNINPVVGVFVFGLLNQFGLNVVAIFFFLLVFQFPAAWLPVKQLRLWHLFLVFIGIGVVCQKMKWYLSVSVFDVFMLRSYTDRWGHFYSMMLNCQKVCIYT